MLYQWNLLKAYGFHNLNLRIVLNKIRNRIFQYITNIQDFVRLTYSNDLSLAVVWGTDNDNCH